MHGASTALPLQSFLSPPEVIGEAATKQVSANNASNTGLADMMEVQIGLRLFGVSVMSRAIGISEIWDEDETWKVRPSSLFAKPHVDGTGVKPPGKRRYNVQIEASVIYRNNVYLLVGWKVPRLLPRGAQQDV
jgi:hypothetical protein